MEYNEYLEKHSDSIFHYCLPAKPGTKVIVNSESTNYKDVYGIIDSYEISEFGDFVRIYIEDKQVMRIRPITDFGKTIFICGGNEK